MMKSDRNKKSKRDSFGSSFGVLVALAGSAIGLGNIWRFPYLVGENGGAAFILIYLFFVIVLGLPLMMSEFVIGRRSHKNVMSAFSELAPSSKWNLIGVICILTPFIILSFYSVVGGWSLHYFLQSCAMQFNHGKTADHGLLFNQFISNSWAPVLFSFLFLGITAMVLLKGISGGIEKFSKVMMPVLFFLVLAIAVQNIFIPGSSAGFSYILKPDFSKVTPDTVIAALGQSFFSLSVGMGAVLTYGSYVRDDENIAKTSLLTAVSDTVFAIIAGCAVMPAVFAYGISPEQGPGLVFVTLPSIFTNMKYGSVVAILFFLALVLAALTSALSLMEVIVSFAVDKFDMSRKKAILIAFSLLFTLSALCSLSFGVLSDFRLFGKTIFDFCDYVSSNLMLTIGAILIAVFVGWRLGKADFTDELTNHGQLRLPQWFVKILFFIIRYICPVVITLILINSLLTA